MVIPSASILQLRLHGFHPTMHGTSISPPVSGDGMTLTSQETEFCSGAVSEEQEKGNRVGEDEAQEEDIKEQHDAKGYDDLERQADDRIANPRPEARDSYWVNAVLERHMPLSPC